MAKFDLHNIVKDYQETNTMSGKTQNIDNWSNHLAKYIGKLGGGTNTSGNSDKGKPNPTTSSYNTAYQQELERQRQLRESQRRFIENSFNSLIQQLQSGYDYGVGQANSTADKSLQDAYISKMQTERELPQKLSALGITGGASESTLSGISNSYGQSRNKVEAQRAQSVASLLQQLQRSKAEAEAERANQLVRLGIY